MKKILFLTYRLPNPLMEDGYSIRVLNLAKILSKKFSLDLVSLYQKKVSPEKNKKLLKIFGSVHLFYQNTFTELLGAIKGFFSNGSIQENIYFSSSMRRWIKKNYHEYDLI